MSVLAWLFIGIVVAGVTACGLLWFLGWPHLPNAAVFDVTQVLDLLKIALCVVAGFGGVVLLAVNYRKQRATDNEHALAVEKAERETTQTSSAVRERAPAWLNLRNVELRSGTKSPSGASGGQRRSVSIIDRNPSAKRWDSPVRSRWSIRSLCSEPSSRCAIRSASSDGAAAVSKPATCACHDR